MTAEFLSEEEGAALARSLEGKLPPGRKILVEFLEDGVKIGPPDAGDESPLAETHEDLYGCMLAVDESLSSSGIAWVFALLLCAIAASVGLHLGWFDGLFSFSLDPVRSIWFYGLLVIGSLIVGFAISNAREKIAYHRRRGELLDAINGSGLSYYAVLARIKDDSGLFNVATRLKKDSRMERDIR